jgi:hypothetical protein
MGALARSNVVPEADARTMKSALECVDRDSEPGSRFRCAPLLDVAKKNDLAVQRIEVGERRREDVDALSEGDCVVGIDDLGEDGILGTTERDRCTAVALEQPQPLAPHDREQPAPE